MRESVRESERVRERESGGPQLEETALFDRAIICCGCGASRRFCSMPCVLDVAHGSHLRRHNPPVDGCFGTEEDLLRNDVAERSFIHIQATRSIPHHMLWFKVIWPCRRLFTHRNTHTPTPIERERVTRIGMSSLVWLLLCS